MHLHEFSAIIVFGLGAAIVGFLGIGVTTQALREAYAVPSAATRRYVVASMLLIMSVDLLIAAMGCWVTLLDMRIEGGVHG